MNRLMKSFKSQRKEDTITFVLNLKLPEFKRPSLNYLGLISWVQIVLFLLEEEKSDLDADMFVCRGSLGKFFLFFDKGKSLNNPKNTNV